MNLKEMKKKYDSGEYILIIEKAHKGSGNWFIQIPQFWNKSTESAKLIHKKHEDILNAYFEDNDIGIEKKPSNPNVYIWHSETNFVDNYNEEYRYRLKEKPKNVETKEQNSFNKFGFETPEFEGEILKEVQEKREINYIGYFIGTNGFPYPCLWTQKGTAWKCSVKGEKLSPYNLIPIKKPWYKYEDNFPCLCHLKSIDQNIESFEVLSDINEYKSYNKKFTVRPATKEEALKLVVDED